VAIEFNCPHCGKLLTTSDERASAQAKCPACGDLIVVPAPAAATALAGGVPSPAMAQTAAWSDPLASAASNSAIPPTQTSSVPAAAFQSLPGTTTASGRSNAPLAPPRPSIRCSHCGVPADVNAVYCATCGASLSDAVPSLQYAAFWQRVAAALIDLIILGIAEEAVRFVLPGRMWVGENFGFALWFLYYTALESSREQATIGKRILGIIVCAADGRRLTFPRAAIRTLAKVLSLLICGVGYLMPLLTPHRQALHDILTDAVVVRK
jgi:uncharacterized RDD family membrane protein YckC/phage FluMu protein Com